MVPSRQFPVAREERPVLVLDRYIFGNGTPVLAFGAQDRAIIGEPGLKKFSLGQGLIWQQEVSNSVNPGSQMRPCDPLAAF